MSDRANATEEGKKQIPHGDDSKKSNDKNSGGGPSEAAGQEGKQNELDPSAPGETGTTPGSNGK